MIGMLTPEPEFYVISVVPFSVTDDGFRVEAVFTDENDALAHAERLEKSTNYQFVTKPHKEMMSVVLDRLLQQKIGCLATSGAKEIVLKL